MNKKSIAMLLASVLGVSLVGCGSAKESETVVVENTEAVSTSSESVKTSSEDVPTEPETEEEIPEAAVDAEEWYLPVSTEVTMDIYSESGSMDYNFDEKIMYTYGNAYAFGDGLMACFEGELPDEFLVSASEPAVGLVVALAYSPLITSGLITSWQVSADYLENDIQREFELDENGRLIKIVSNEEDVNSITYSYNEAGQVTSIVYDVPEDYQMAGMADRIDLVYDEAGQLTEFTFMAYEGDVGSSTHYTIERDDEGRIYKTYGTLPVPTDDVEYSKDCTYTFENGLLTKVATDANYFGYLNHTEDYYAYDEGNRLVETTSGDNYKQTVNYEQKKNIVFGDDHSPSMAGEEANPTGETGASSETGASTADLTAEAQELFGMLAGNTFYYSSGAGAWYTSLNVNADGTFNGYYEDTDYGVATQYRCEFSGNFGDVTKLDEYRYTFALQSLAPLYGVDTTWTEQIEGVDFTIITTNAAGLEYAKDMEFYKVGTPISEIPSDRLQYFSYDDLGGDTLAFNLIYSVKDESAFRD